MTSFFAAEFSLYYADAVDCSLIIYALLCFTLMLARCALRVDAGAWLFATRRVHAAILLDILLMLCRAYC